VFWPGCRRTLVVVGIVCSGADQFVRGSPDGPPNLERNEAILFSVELDISRIATAVDVVARFETAHEVRHICCTMYIFISL